MKNFLACFLICFTSLSFAGQSSKIFSEKKLTEMEEYVAQELKKNKVEGKRLFFLYLLAGREAYAYRYHSRARKFYEEAINVTVKYDKTEAFVNLMAIAHLSKDYKKLSEELQRAKKYFKHNANYSKNAQPLIDYYQAVTDLKKRKNDLQPYRGVFNWSYNLLALEEKIKGKEFLEALSMFDPTKVGRSKNYETQVTYDMLNVLVKKKKVRKLHCHKAYKKFKKTWSYSMKVCGVLLSYLKNGKKDPMLMSDLKKYFREDDTQKRYFYSALEELI